LVASTTVNPANPGAPPTAPPATPTASDATLPEFPIPQDNPEAVDLGAVNPANPGDASTAAPTASDATLPESPTPQNDPERVAASTSPASAAMPFFLANFPVDLTEGHPAEATTPLAPPAPLPISRPGVKSFLAFRPKPADRRFNPADLTVHPPDRQESPVIANSVGTGRWPSAVKGTAPPRSLMQADLAPVSPDSPVAVSEPPPVDSLTAPVDPFLAESPAPPRLQPQIRTKLTQALTLGAIATLLILGWTYATSKQSERPSAPNPTEQLHNSVP
jgi:hypothetical protein